MKKVLKIVAFIFGGIVILALGGSFASEHDISKG